ncbi:hypothetical protein VTK73DRAFT_2527 [Phialemonium thermophilum]|uniref:Uncharacterized protein n=1 Tax=Phialemonium thermophilum TaxID=223376 RepID=A0ABR3VS33_9PEZI
MPFARECSYIVGLAERAQGRGHATVRIGPGHFCSYSMVMNTASGTSEIDHRPSDGGGMHAPDASLARGRAAMPWHSSPLVTPSRTRLARSKDAHRSRPRPGPLQDAATARAPSPPFLGEPSPCSSRKPMCKPSLRTQQEKQRFRLRALLRRHASCKARIFALYARRARPPSSHATTAVLGLADRPPYLRPALPLGVVPGRAALADRSLRVTTLGGSRRDAKGQA